MLGLFLFYNKTIRMNDYILLIDCTDAKGLVYKITEVLFKHDTNIDETSEFVDAEANHFYMRVLFSGKVSMGSIETEIKALLPPSALVKIISKTTKDIIVFATKEHHCLSDLLIRNQYKTLPFNIKAVVSNYNTLEHLVTKFNIPYYTVPVAGTDVVSKMHHEEAIQHVLKRYVFDYIVLAKYMRILSADFTKQYAQQIINIHHSFLPAFIGTNPYKQAYERGVKVIGATAHFVTDDLDEGPIIYQDVIHVNHTKNAAEMATAGRDVETNVLSKALKLVFEDRVFIKANKTVIFE
jgi:formyltetrahydrofolate deformylase